MLGSARNNSLSLADGPWLHFFGSFGDLYFIASMLHLSPLFDVGVKLLSSAKYFDLLRVFLGLQWVKSNVVFYEDHLGVNIRRDYYALHWRHIRMENISPFVNPPNQFWRNDIILSPLICDHPHLATLLMYNKIAYYEALMVILEIFDHRCTPRLPSHWSHEDHSKVDQQLKSIQRPSVLINTNNYSQKDLSVENYIFICKSLKNRGITCFFNTFGIDESIKKCLAEHAACIDIPGHLINLYQSRFDCCAGVCGGALTIANSFSKTNVCQIYTDCKNWTKHASLEIQGRGIGLDLIKAEILTHDISVHFERKSACLDARGINISIDLLSSFVSMVESCLC